MGKIVILDENTSNKIAAGEVIERPASVVKEMVENSIDAGATSITVEIKKGGVSLIKVTDNGTGIGEDDAEIAFERHATSKIRSSDDLETIATLGFRGEALASIASVSTVELTTKVKGSPQGTYVKVQGGVVKEINPIGCPVGTTFVVRDLFYNTPARFKFLKKDSTEAGYISDIINRIALAKPHISFKLISNNAVITHTPGNNDLLSTIFSVYGKEVAKSVIEVQSTDEKVRIWGYVGKPEIARANRTYQSMFLNGRYIKSRVVASAIEEAYKTFLMKKKHPFIVLNMEVNPMLVDVNVHPTKMEVRFSDEQDIFRSVYHAVKSAFLGKSLVRTVQADQHEDKRPFAFENKITPKKEYLQQDLDMHRLSVKEAHAAKEEKEHQKGSPEEEKQLPTNEDAFLHKADKALEPPENKSGINPLDKEKGELKTDIFLKKEESLSVEAKKDNEPIPTPVGSKNCSAEQALSQKVGSEGDGRAECQKKEQEPQEPEEETNESDLFADARIIGQVFLTYILLQKKDELILIDQHAAHERIMYENLKKKYLTNEPLAQMLIAPLVLEVTHQEIKFLEERKEFFHKIGFIYENFGNNSIILRAVPGSEGTNSVKDVFLEMLDTLMGSSNADEDKMADDTLYTIACKAAIKANKRLDELEIKEMLKDLTRMDNPYTCPHGRPTVIKITKHELEKMFKRIV